MRRLPARAPASLTLALGAVLAACVAGAASPPAPAPVRVWGQVLPRDTTASLTLTVCTSRDGAALVTSPVHVTATATAAFLEAELDPARLPRDRGPLVARFASGAVPVTSAPAFVMHARDGEALAPRVAFVTAQVDVSASATWFRAVVASELSTPAAGRIVWTPDGGGPAVSAPLALDAGRLTASAVTTAAGAVDARWSAAWLPEDPRQARAFVRVEARDDGKVVARSLSTTSAAALAPSSGVLPLSDAGLEVPTAQSVSLQLYCPGTTAARVRAALRGASLRSGVTTGPGLPLSDCRVIETKEGCWVRRSWLAVSPLDLSRPRLVFPPPAPVPDGWRLAELALVSRHASGVTSL